MSSVRARQATSHRRLSRRTMLGLSVGMGIAALAAGCDMETSALPLSPHPCSQSQPNGHTDPGADSEKVTILSPVGNLDAVPEAHRVATMQALESQMQQAIAFYRDHPRLAPDVNPPHAEAPPWTIEITREAVPSWESKGAVIVQAKDNQGKLVFCS